MIKFLNICGFSLLIISVFLFGLKEMAAEMGIAVAASFVFLAFANLDKFSKFKGAGFEAELRTAVQEANASITQLKSVAIPLVITNLEMITKDNRWADGTGFMDKGDTFEPNKHALFDQILKLIDSNKLNDTTISRLKYEYININAWDMVEEVINKVKDKSEKVSDIIGVKSYSKAPAFSVLENYLKSNPDKITDDINEKLEIIKNYYIKYDI